MNKITNREELLYLMIKNFFLLLLTAAVNVPQAMAMISSVPSSDLTGTEICKPGFSPPQCKAAFFLNTQNVAYQNNGSARPAVAKDNILNYDSIHQPEFVNDGAYGNGTSWISNSQNSWIKIDLGQVLRIDKIMLGRDRLGFYDDRDPGQILVSVATNDEIYANGDDSNDDSEYVQVFDSEYFSFDGVINNNETLQFHLTPVTARFVKLTVARQGTALDEIEVLTSEDNPVLLVNLNSFNAETIPGGVRVEWETRAEIDSGNFHLWRFLEIDESRYTQLHRITNQPISAQGTASLYFYDDFNVKVGKTYVYYLEEVELDGRQIFYLDNQAEVVTQ